MSDEKSSKITFKVRQKDQSEYKLPPGLTHTMSEIEQEFTQKQMTNFQNASNSQHPDTNEAIRKLDQYEKALEQSQVKENRTWSIKVALFKYSFSLLLLLFVFAIAFSVWRHIQHLNKSSERSDAKERIDLVTINDESITNPQKDQKAQVDKYIQQRNRWMQKQAERHAKQNASQQAKDDVAVTVNTEQNEENASLQKAIQLISATPFNKEQVSILLGQEFSNRPDDLNYHMQLYRELLSAKQQKFAAEQYAAWLKSNPLSYAANMISALLLDSTNGQIIEHLKNACTLSASKPQFLPYQKLLEIYETVGYWQEALMVCEEMIYKFPNNDFARRKYCEVKIFNGTDKNKAYEELRQYTKSKPGHEQADILLKTAQDFMDEEVSQNLLTNSGIREKNPDAYHFYKLRGALIFGQKLDDNDLAQIQQLKGCREMLLLYYVSHKNDNQALSITTPPNEYPDLYKVFLTWYNGDKDYVPQLADKLLRKDMGFSTTVTMLCHFWKNEITQEQLRGNLILIPTEDLGFVYTILAEDAKRKNRGKSAEVLYDKAEKLPRNIYNTMLKNYR